MTNQNPPSNSIEDARAQPADIDLFGVPIPGAAKPSKVLGSKVGKVIEVSPDECAVWSHNPRNLDRLIEAKTQELRDSLASSGG